MVICVNSRGAHCSSQSFAIHCKSCGSNQTCTKDRHYCADNACSGCRAILLSGSARMSNSAAPTNSAVPKGFSNLFLSPVIRVTLSPRVITGTISKPGITQDTQEQTYHLHSSLLTDHSQYFASLHSFNNRASISDASVTLSEPVDDPTAFQRFVEFLYCGTYDYTPNVPVVGSFGYVDTRGCNVDLSSVVAALPMHAKCYALGERLMAPGFKQVALGKFKSALRTLVTFAIMPDVMQKCVGLIVDTIRIIYENTHRPYSSRDEPPQREEMVQRPTPTQSKGRASVYANIPAEGRSHSEGGSLSVVQQLIDSNDPARQVLANFCAVKVEMLRANEEFRSVVREWGEFAEDLMLEVNGATNMRG